MVLAQHGLLLAVTAHAARHYDVTHVQLAFARYIIEAQPWTLIRVRTYDAAPPTRRLCAHRVPS